MAVNKPVSVWVLAATWLAITSTPGYTGDASSDALITDLLTETAWQSPDPTRWEFGEHSLNGRTFTFPEVATREADATANLVSERQFGGQQLSLVTDMMFERSRYLGVYLDYDPETDTGIWMATGHPLAAEESDAGKVPMAYIKTIDDGDWTVRATGELLIKPGQELRLRWIRDGADYQVWQDERLVASYRPRRNYGPGHVRLRLMSAIIEIDRLEMTSEYVK